MRKHPTLHYVLCNDVLYRKIKEVFQMISISIKGIMDTIRMNAEVYGIRVKELKTNINNRIERFNYLKSMIYDGEMSVEDEDYQLEIRQIYKDNTRDVNEMRRILKKLQRLEVISNCIDKRISGEKEGDDD